MTLKTDTDRGAQAELALELADDPPELMRELCSMVDSLNASWPDRLIEAVVFRIPVYPDGQVPDRVEPERIDGQEAVDLCKKALRAFSRPRDQHPGSVMRLPGYVLLDRLLLDDIDSVNAKKKHLQDTIKKHVPDPRARNAYCRKHFPGRVMLQVYRQIPTARSPLDSVSFTWSPGVQATRKLTQPEAIALLSRRLESRADLSHTKRYKALRMAIDKAHSVGPDAQFIVQKPHAPYPVATLFKTRGRNAEKTMMPLSLPLFVGPGINGKAAELGSLGTFDTAQRRKTRSDTKSSDMLFQPLYLRVRPASA